MGSREIVSPEGLRLDGRRCHEIRKIECNLGMLPAMDGSAFFQQGNTQVIATVLGPREARRRADALHNKAFVTCEFSMANFATSERKSRSKSDRKSKEMAGIIRQTFESAILLELYPRSQIDVQVQVVMEDGGALSAAINAVSMAMVNAGIPMRDLVCACSAGFMDSKAIVDLNYSERSRNTPEIYVAIFPKASKKAKTVQENEEDEAKTSSDEPPKELAMLHMSNKIPIQNFAEVVELAMDGCRRVHAVVESEIRSYSQGSFRKYVL